MSKPRATFHGVVTRIKDGWGVIDQALSKKRTTHFFDVTENPDVSIGDQVCFKIECSKRGRKAMILSIISQDEAVRAG